MFDLQFETGITLERIKTRLAGSFVREQQSPEWKLFLDRLDRHFPMLFEQLVNLYGEHYDFFYHLEALVHAMGRMWMERSSALKSLDAVREQQPHWFQSEQMVGAACYVDLAAGTLSGLRLLIPYFKELGLTYLHLMPLFLAPEGNNDGGYAVSSYREVDPALGTMQELAEIAADLRANGISLVLDFVFNHTSDEHAWARRALSGDREYQGFYYIFPDRTIPDQYQPYLRDIFPDQRPGSFTYRPEIDSWVWTTFNSFQWDLRYHNPAVFVRMAEEMLFLANQGAEILRLDAVVFAWKQMGTSSENLPQVHTLIRAFNAVARIAAPSLLFKSEAIVHPDDVVSFVSEDQCQLSYNPLLMALLWETLATREVRLLATSMGYRFGLDAGCAWLNYVRSHDDIGWTFDDGDAARLGINAFDHRRFLNNFYTGRFPGSFARGELFQANPATGDARVSGTAAALAGLQQAVESNDPKEIEHAIRRIHLLYSVVMSIGGIPLIFLGDELGTLNDWDYLNDPARREDSRWVHRAPLDPARLTRRHDASAIEGRVFGGMIRIIAARKACRALAGHDMTVIDSGNTHVFAYLRRHAGRSLLVLANMSEHEVQIAPEVIVRALGAVSLRDVIRGERFTPKAAISLEAYRFHWLEPEEPR